MSFTKITITIIFITIQIILTSTAAFANTDSGNIAGTVWMDENNNGVQELNETDTEMVIVYIQAEGSDVIEGNIVENGTFAFNKVIESGATFDISSARAEVTGVTVEVISTGTLAVGAGGLGIVLGAFGFVANAAQTETSLGGIRLMFSVAPATLAILGAVFIFFYRIDSKLMREIEDDLAARHAAPA